MEAITSLNKRAKAEASSGKTEETSLKMHIGKVLMLDKLLMKFILLNGVDVDIVQRRSFIDFVNAVAEHGSHYKLPCSSVVKTKLVRDLEKEIGEHVANVKKSCVRSGCTLVSDIWRDEERSFICIFAYSIEGAVLLNALEIPNDESTSYLPYEISDFVTQEIGANNVVQRLTSSDLRRVGLFDIIANANHWISMPNADHLHVYETKCVGEGIEFLFQRIYRSIAWIRKAINQARAVVTMIHKHDGILSLTKQFTNYWGLQQSSTTKLYSDYYMLQSIMRLEAKLRLLVSSSEWLSLFLEKDVSGIKVAEIIRDHEFWSEGKEVLHALEPIFQLLCLVDGCGATFGFLYAAMEIADEAIRKIYETNVPKYHNLWTIFKNWRDHIIHPMHAAAAFLNPAYMCGENFIENDTMKKGMNLMLENLVGVEEKKKFVQEMLLYRAKVPELFTSMAKTMLKETHPRDWWDYCGDVLPVLKKYAIRILSQPCSTSFCRQSLSAFEIAQTEKREPLMPAVDNYLYLRTNVLLMENFNTMKDKSRKPLDLEKLSELPDFTEFMNENITLLNESKVPLLDRKLNCRSALVSKDGESEKHLRLQFITKLPLSLVKGNKSMVQRPIHVILVDSGTGRVVQSGPLSMLKLMVTVIGGDFDDKAGKNWTKEFFDSNELKGREGNMPLLNGDLSVTLNKGLGRLGAITFNDVSSWTSSGKFRLGVKTALGCCEGIRVLEATSNAFAVEDGRRTPEGEESDGVYTAEDSISSMLEKHTGDLILSMWEKHTFVELL